MIFWYFVGLIHTLDLSSINPAHYFFRYKVYNDNLSKSR